MSKAVYFGAGTDFHYLQYMPEYISHFYMIDSQPFSEDGLHTSWMYEPSTNYQFWCCLCPFLVPCIFPRRNTYSRSEFLDDLKENARKYKIDLMVEEKDKLIFKYRHQTITYFINTSDPQHLDKIADDIHDYEHIMIMGYYPNKDILNYTTKKPIIWGNNTTFYCKDNYFDKFAKENNEDNKIIYLLNYQDDFQELFSGFNIIEETGIKHFFYDWDELIMFSGGHVN